MSENEATKCLECSCYHYCSMESCIEDIDENPYDYSMNEVI